MNFNKNMSHKQSQSYITNPNAVRIGNEVESLILESMQYQKVGLGGLLPRKGDLIPDYVDDNCVIEIKYSGTNTIQPFNLEQLNKYVNAFNKNHAYFLLVTDKTTFLTSSFIEIQAVEQVVNQMGEDFYYKGNGALFNKSKNHLTELVDQLLNVGNVDYDLGQSIIDELRRMHNEANAK